MTDTSFAKTITDRCSVGKILQLEDDNLLLSIIIVAEQTLLPGNSFRCRQLECWLRQNCGSNSRKGLIAIHMGIGTEINYPRFQ